MAIINTTVAKSQNVRDAALNLNAKAFEVRRTLAAVWDLKPTGAEPPPAEAAFSLDMKNESHESVVGDGDERVKVDDIHFAPGGKYRSIVKLFIHYEFQKPDSWAMGTGWLVSPDVFVTAGHCSYDWGHKMGRATEVKAYIGYKGRESEKDANVQFRRVKRIVTTEGWVKTKGQKCFDVSFMQVEKPFSGIRPIKFIETPSQGSEKLGVVGYPGDLYDHATREKGAFMYEMFMDTNYDLATQADTMLEYQIDTFGGNSGSPVLREHDLVSIGAHVYGGTYNSASVIGKYGNPYYDYLAAFGLPLPNDGLNLIPVTGNTAISAPVPAGFDGQIPPSMGFSGSIICEICKRREVKQPSTNPSDYGSSTPASRPNNQSLRRPHPSRGLVTQYGAVVQGRSRATNGQLSEAEEGFFLDVLKKAASVGAPLLGNALKTGLPIALGPIGGPVGALAGFALNAAGKLAAESAMAESVIDSPTPPEGSMERAIMAEAVLSTIQSMELNPELEESIFTDMRDVVMKALPAVRKAAPRVMGAMMEPALRIALDSLHKYNQNGGAEGFEDQGSEPFRPNVQYSSAIDQASDRDAEAFLQHVQTAMKHGAESTMDSESEEGFFDIISAGIRFAGQGLSAVAQHGLPLLANAFGGAESLEEDSPSSTSTQAFSADALAHRALVAEAALQAVMKLPPQQLEEEGFFDFVSNAVKTIAPVAMKMAPAIASAINPTVGNLLKGVLGQEPAAVSVQGSGRNKVTAPPKLTAKKSLASLRQRTQNGSQYNRGTYSQKY